MSDVLLGVLLGVLLSVATASIAIGVFLGWMWMWRSGRLAPWLVSLFHRCGKEHPDWTHEQWVEQVEKPVTRAWYKRHDL